MDPENALYTYKSALSSATTSANILSLTDVLKTELEAVADLGDALRSSSLFSLFAKISITVTFTLGTLRQVRQVQCPTSLPLAPHRFTGSGPGTQTPSFGVL